MDRINYAKAILKEWNNFQAGKNVDKNIVDAVIFESWLRCKSHGLDPCHLTRKYISPGELAKKQEAQAILINAVSYVTHKILR